MFSCCFKVLTLVVIIHITSPKIEFPPSDSAVLSKRISQYKKNDPNSENLSLHLGHKHFINSNYKQALVHVHQYKSHCEKETGSKMDHTERSLKDLMIALYLYHIHLHLKDVDRTAIWLRTALSKKDVLKGSNPVGIQDVFDLFPVRLIDLENKLATLEGCLSAHDTVNDPESELTDLEAIKIIDSEIMPECGEFDKFKFRKAELLTERGQLSSAMELVNALLAADSLNPRYLFLKGKIVLNLGDFDYAKRILGMAYTAESNNAEYKGLYAFSKELVRALKKMGSYFEAGARKVEELIAEGRLTGKKALSQIYSQQCRGYIDNDDFEHALALSSKLIRMEKNRENFLLKINALLGLEKYKKAKMYCKKVIKYFSKKDQQVMKEFEKKLEEIKKDEKGEKNYYNVLGVEEKATMKEIKKRYRQLTKKYHPDKAPETKKEAYEAKLQKVNEAYNVLSDEKKRKEYDQKRKQGGGFGGFGGFDMSDFFGGGGGGFQFYF